MIPPCKVSSPVSNTWERKSFSTTTLIHLLYKDMYFLFIKYKRGNIFLIYNLLIINKIQITMKKYLSILKNKIFWFVMCFALSSLSLMLGYNILGALFMVYPVLLTLIGIVYGAILNPIREYRDNKRYLSYQAVVTGQTICDGIPVPMAKVVIANANGVYDIDTSNYYTFSDKNGNFSIPHVKNGEFVCRSWKNGYSSKDQKFTIVDSESISLTIELYKI
jgi:hypothetical protein